GACHCRTGGAAGAPGRVLPWPDAGRVLLDFELAGLHDHAVVRDLQLVGARRPAVRLGDLEVGDLRAGRDRLLQGVDHLAVLEGPLRAQGAGGRAIGGDGRVDGVAGSEGGGRRGDPVVVAGRGTE